MSDRDQNNDEETDNSHRGIVSDTETLTSNPKGVPEPNESSNRRDESNNDTTIQDDGGGDSDLTSSGNHVMQYPPSSPQYSAFSQHAPLSFPYPSQWQSMSNPPPAQPSLLQFYEAQMRDHAAAYASAAASAAWVSAQIAADMASASNTTVPSGLPVFPIHMQPPQPYMPLQNTIPPPAHGLQYHHPYNTFNENDFDADSASYSHRRKRQQRMAPSPETRNQHSNAEHAYFKPEKRGRRRRRFGNSDSEDAQQQQQQQQFSNRRRNRKMALPSSSSDGGCNKKKQRQPNDQSLLGKTGVSALYEWCNKRRTTPTFTLNGEDGKHSTDFEIIVHVDGLEYGRGRAKTKNSARQEAARKALQALLPGVIFDEATGILTQLPSPQQSRNTTLREPTSLEDLAPNLAKRLAIGQTEDDKLDDDVSENPKMSNTKKKRHKLQQVYPGTTTTTEEEDENEYYASRGASVCSALLRKTLWNLLLF